MTQIAIIDYGMGNLHSVAKALQHAGNLSEKNILVTSDADQIIQAESVILPGVGAMRDCIGEIQKLELIDCIKQSTKTKPFLGVCVGMQALLSHSEENNGVNCLDIVPGEVKHLKSLTQLADEKLKIPHMGWNTVHQTISHPLWKGIKQDEYFYFVHSYACHLRTATASAGTCHYGADFSVAITEKNIFAVQFHPEKSASAGLQLYQNFIHWDGSC